MIRKFRTRGLWTAALAAAALGCAGAGKAPAIPAPLAMIRGFCVPQRAQMNPVIDAAMAAGWREPAFEVKSGVQVPHLSSYALLAHGEGKSAPLLGVGTSQLFFTDHDALEFRACVATTVEVDELEALRSEGQAWIGVAPNLHVPGASTDGYLYLEDKNGPTPVPEDDLKAIAAAADTGRLRIVVVERDRNRLWMLWGQVTALERVD